MRRVQILLLLCCGMMAAPKAWSQEAPRLVILISIDQMRHDYFERFGREFSGGLKRLYDEGMVYTSADLNYAASETGPGHATLVTGAYPRRHGIPANEWPDRASRRQVYCVSDTSAGAVNGEGGGVSPKNLMTSAIGDWLKEAAPQSRAVAIAVKDRAAILMGGRRPDYAFWYNSESGRMVTSDYYVKALPEWVKQFNASNWVEKHVPAVWKKLKQESVYAQHGPDEMAGEFVWGESTAFPHAFQPERKNRQMLTSPWGDMMVLDFAAAALRAEKLGQRPQTDFLALGLSCTDYVGHAFGPDSHEMHDHLLRLDSALGKFLKTVQHSVGKGRFVVVVSADHAVMPLPEYLTQIKKEKARRILAERDLMPQIQNALANVQRELGANEPLVQQNAFLNYAAANHGVDSLALEGKVRAAFLQVEGIAEVYFRRELLGANPSGDLYLEKFRRSYFGPRGEDFQIRFCENCLVTSRPTGTSHGSVYRYDTHVPLIFFGGGIKAARSSRAVHTADVAPTLAKLLGIPYPETVEGLPLEEVVK